MKTDPTFDRALEWLAKHEKRSKSDVIRDAVMTHYAARKGRFVFGALSKLRRAADSRKRVLRELKAIDEDRDLD